MENNFKKNFKIINIVGTNGKGSTTKYLTDALIEKGYKVGTFTSPHILKYNERITINNKQIQDDEFYEIVNLFLDICQEEKVMFYPITYIAAMIHFMRNDIDYAVIEAGVGGEYDPTNVIDGDYGILTSIGIDHLEWFKTFENIAIDKAGIMNPGMTFILPTHLDKYSSDTFKRIAKERGTKIIEVENNKDEYDKRNEILANALFEHIFHHPIPFFKKPFARTEKVTINNSNVILDVAHNEAAIKESLKLIKNNKWNFEQVILSLSKNKDDSNMQNLFKGKKIFIYEHEGFNSKSISDFEVDGDVIDDLNLVKDIIKGKNTLVIGSFYLIHDFLKVVNYEQNKK